MKLIEITYVDTCWTNDAKELCIESAEKHILINIDHIATISKAPIHAKEGYMVKDLYYVKTTVPTSRGINGVDYSSYYVTDATYLNLITKLEVL